MIWILVVVGVVIFGIFLYWLLVTTEGVFLGRRMVIWLYDLTAHNYDSIKEFSETDDSFFIARPVIRSVRDVRRPLILDVATGTGRVPCALLREPDFEGLVVGLDASKRMLELARIKLGKSDNFNLDSASLIQQFAAPLPFLDNSFDYVSCLEALEFFPSDLEAISEMVRVLKPGCTLATSRRRGREARLFLSRHRSRAEFEALLNKSGLADVQISLWELDYDMVTAIKSPGSV
jgi:ubiquinone/menaquinone biosynthesis C-methylase UbiE